MGGKLQEKLQKAPQQPGLSPPPVDAVKIERGGWNDVEAKKLLGDRRTQTADKFFGLWCAKIREIVKEWGIEIKPDAVTGARLFRLGDQKEGSRSRRVPSERHINANTVPGLPTDANYGVTNDWFYQHFKVSLADADLQTVIDMVRSGAFATYGLWLNDFDITIDCSGVVNCQKLKKWMLQQKNMSS